MNEEWINNGQENIFPALVKMAECHVTRKNTDNAVILFNSHGKRVKGQRR